MHFLGGFENALQHMGQLIYISDEDFAYLCFFIPQSQND